MIKNISHVDEKMLSDKALSAKIDDPLNDLTLEEIGKHYAKPIRGYVVISNDRTGEIIETPNLVLLSGREFIAQKIADIASDGLVPASSVDMTNFKIRYFGVGIGGADTSAQPNKVGPFDNDIDLNIPGKFADSSVSTDETRLMSQKYQYIHDGRMKKIESDHGSIKIVKEDHNILISGQEVEIEAYTTIKYTMIVKSSELYKESAESGPFAFNEAALYAVDHETIINSGIEYSIPRSTDGTLLSRYATNYRAFARFTTITKWLEINDSLKIEWYILV